MMLKDNRMYKSYFVILFFFTFASTPMSAFSHCDTLDGPVVTDAIKALQHEDVSPVLKWVTPQDEEQVKATFQHTLAVRKLGKEAQELADKYFFETLVRVHRASEGAPYTGLKPAGQDESPAIEAADLSLQDDSVDEVIELVVHLVKEGIKSRFHEANQLHAKKDENVEIGRKFVHAYVNYIHYVERLFNDATSSIHIHEQANHQTLHEVDTSHTDENQH